VHKPRRPSLNPEEGQSPLVPRVHEEDEARLLRGAHREHGGGARGAVAEQGGGRGALQTTGESCAGGGRLAGTGDSGGGRRLGGE
jgi:hypothetical protein